jgi:hypothetical protein
MGEFVLLLRLSAEIFDLLPDISVNPKDLVFASSAKLVALLKVP